jgi:transformation/transcription domain-associated protein
MEHVRDSETTPSLSSVVPSFVAVLQEGTPAFQTTSPEYAFRKALLDIILRLLYTDPGRFPLQPFFTFVLHTMRTDNEENASSCLKALSDSARLLKSTPAETWAELTAVYQELCKAVGGSVEKQFGAQERPADTILASVGSFRVLNEFAHIFISYLHAHRMLPPQNVQSVLGATTLVLNTQVPAQKQAREDFEAMGGIWAGMAPSITNSQDYEDLLTAQSKVGLLSMNCV